MRESDEIDLSIYSIALRKAWPLLFLLTLLGGGAAVAYTYYSKTVYEARSTILLLPDAGAGAGGGAAEALASAIGKNANPLDILQGVIESHTAYKLISEKTGIKVDKVGQYVHVKKDPEKNQLTISADDKDSKKALKAVAVALDTINYLQKILGFNAAEQQADMMEDSVKTKTVQLRDSEQRLADFMKLMKSPSDPNDLGSISVYFTKPKDLEFQLSVKEKELSVARQQANASGRKGLIQPTSSPVAEAWRTRLNDLELQLAIARRTYGDTAPQVVQLKNTYAETQRQAKTEIAKSLQSIQQGLDPTIAALEAEVILLKSQLAMVKQAAVDAPNEAVQLQSLMQEVRIEGTVLENLRAKYEEARLNAQIERVRWSTLEYPFVDEDPTNKHFFKTGAIGAVLGFIFAALIVMSRTRKKTLTPVYAGIPTDQSRYPESEMPEPRR
jgi:hypothetical protein